MACEAIPVDLLNPGQVFASLGFLEVANVLCEGAEGGFDWSDRANVRFALMTAGNRNPFEVVLEFLANAEIRRVAPNEYRDPLPKVNKKEKDSAHEQSREAASAQDLVRSEIFPATKPDAMTLPIRLVREGGYIDITHWCDGSSRNDFKLYSGNRSAAQIARAMLRGTREKPRKNQQVGDIKTKGICAMWEEDAKHLLERPFDVLTAVAGTFNFDPRGAWTAIDAGFSPNDQKFGVMASPIVELLAAIGVEHARPDEYETRRVRYGAWGEILPPALARPALAGVRFGIPLRRFRFELALSGKNKVVTFAEEEITS